MTEPIASRSPIYVHSISGKLVPLPAVGVRAVAKPPAKDRRNPLAVTASQQRKYEDQFGVKRAKAYIKAGYTYVKALEHDRQRLMKALKRLEANEEKLAIEAVAKAMNKQRKPVNKSSKPKSLADAMKPKARLSSGEMTQKYGKPKSLADVISHANGRKS